MARVKALCCIAAAAVPNLRQKHIHIKRDLRLCQKRPIIRSETMARVKALCCIAAAAVQNLRQKHIHIKRDLRLCQKRPIIREDFVLH